MVGQANIINRFGNVRMEEIRGIRVPFLRVGWNRQFLMMKEFGFEYDASMVAPHSNPPLWPYTLDFKMPHKCTGNNQNCPTRSYPGVWEMVMNQLEAGSGYTCGMVDSCPPNMNGEDVYRMFVHNFNRHFATNRAPYGLYFHTTWFRNAEYLKAFQRFMHDMGKRRDVFFVTAHEAVQWMRNPTPLQHIQNFEPWQCPEKHLEPAEIACNLPNTCKLHSRVLQQDRYLFTCNECPDQYPWVRNEFGMQ